MEKYNFTDYFENQVLLKRPYLKKEWCIYVLNNPVRVEKQEGNRYRFWAQIAELEGKFLRVVAFPDRSFKP